MTIQVRKGGAWQTITSAKVYANGAWRTLVAVKVYAGGAWRTVANFAPAPRPPSGGGSGGGGGTVVVTISPNPFDASARTAIVSQSLTATPSGGLAPYSYAWTVISSTSTVTFGPSNAATTIAQVSLANPDDEASATLRCTATDSLGTSGHADAPGTWTRTA